MKCYVSFPDNTIFGGMALPDESLKNQLQTTIPESTQPASTNSPLRRLLWRLLRKRQPPLQGLWRGPLLLGPWMRSQPERNTHQIDSLGGGKCYIPPGQSLLPGRSLQSPKVPNGDLVAKFQGKDGLAPKGRGTVTDSKHKVRAHIANRDTGNHVASDTNSRLLGSNGLLVEGPIAGGYLWSPLAAGSSGRAYSGNNKHQLHHEGWDYWDNLYGHCDHFCGVSGPQWPQPGDPSHGAHHWRFTNLP